jgi:hypothetical protein
MDTEGRMTEAHNAETEESPYVRAPWPLVTAGIFGVLALALAFGLFANAHLRPGTVAAPTQGAVGSLLATKAPRAAALPVSTPTPSASTQPTVGMAAPAVTGTPTAAMLENPTATAPPSMAVSATTRTEVPTARPTIVPELADEIDNAYQVYWQVRAEALLELDTSRLDEVMAGDHLAAAEELISQLRSEGRAIQTDVTHSYVILTATPGEAVIADEYTDDSYYVEIDSHQSLTQPIGSTVKEQYRMNKVDETWKVVSLVRSP